MSSRKEPPPADHPIILAAKELDNLIVTPHTAWSARESRERFYKKSKKTSLPSCKVKTETASPNLLSSGKLSNPAHAYRMAMPTRRDDHAGFNQYAPYGFMFWFR